MAQARASTPLVFAFGDFRLDTANRTLEHAGRRVSCTGQRFQLLELLVSRAGELVDRQSIRDTLWPDHHVAFDPAINSCVRDLRRTLEAFDDRPVIRTVPKYGYVFEAEVRILSSEESAPRRRFRLPALIASSAALAAICLAALTLQPGRMDAGGSYTPSDAALAAYVQGEDLYRQHEPQVRPRASEYFRTAIEIDDGFALAWAGLADVLYFGGTDQPPDMDASRIAAETALSLDPELARAELRLADIAFTHDWDIDGARRHFRRALDLGTGNVDVRHSYSAFLLATGDHRGAIRELRYALSIDPLSAVMTSDLAWTFALAGEHEAALAMCEVLGELMADEMRALACPLRPLLALGRVEEAALIAAGIMDRAGREIDAADPTETLAAFWTWRAETSRDDVAIAIARARLADVEGSFRALEDARRSQNRRLAFVHLLPEFAALSGQARFRQLAPYGDLPEAGSGI